MMDTKGHLLLCWSHSLRMPPTPKVKHCTSSYLSISVSFMSKASRPPQVPRSKIPTSEIPIKIGTVGKVGTRLPENTEKVKRYVGMSFRVKIIPGYCIDSLSGMWHISDTFFGQEGGKSYEDSCYRRRGYWKCNRWSSI
jgi:hypothetical protein